MQHAVSTFCRIWFQFWIGKFLIKTQCIAVRFYLGYWKQPWFGPAGFENACIFCMCKRRVATKLKDDEFWSILAWKYLQEESENDFVTPNRTRGIVSISLREKNLLFLSEERSLFLLFHFPHHFAQWRQQLQNNRPFSWIFNAEYRWGPSCGNSWSWA